MRVVAVTTSLREISQVTAIDVANIEHRQSLAVFLLAIIHYHSHQ
jgi:hypothetical protein